MDIPTQGKCPQKGLQNGGNTLYNTKEQGSFPFHRREVLPVNCLCKEGELLYTDTMKSLNEDLKTGNLSRYISCMVGGLSEKTV